MESKRNAAVNTCLDLLFRNGQGHKAERLVLTSGEGQDLGGWRRLSMRHYLRYLFDAGAASASRKEVVREAFKMLALRLGKFWEEGMPIFVIKNEMDAVLADMEDNDGK